MAKKFLEAKFNKGDKNVSIGLLLLLWEQEGIYYQYAPELDLTGYGKSEGEAKKSFEYNLDEFVTYTINKNTLFDELERLGWTTNKKKKRVKAPEEYQLLDDNETYRNLLDMPGTQKSSTILDLVF